MKVGDKVTDTTLTWTISKIWTNGDVTLTDDTGYQMDVSSECFLYYYKLQSKPKSKKEKE